MRPDPGFNMVTDMVSCVVSGIVTNMVSSVVTDIVTDIMSSVVTEIVTSIISIVRYVQLSSNSNRLLRVIKNSSKI